ncbi:unnamed protein product [Urochloa decumbens]|uniref:Protein kinase domain-containing protein n=1 Tax=Urochloa decumbens TaxID=240449 RepID=A0ABC9GT55_9POAL
MATSSSLLPVLLLLAAAAAGSSSPCQLSCGGVDIPYPFGIGDKSCFREGFEIECRNKGSTGDVPVLPVPDDTNDKAIWVLDLSVAPLPEALVLLPVAWQCFDLAGKRTGIYPGDVNFNQQGVYRISNTQNELYVLGCNTLVYVKGVKIQGGRFNYSYYTGCVSVVNDTNDPQDGACAGLGCCHVDIPPGLTDTTMSMWANNGAWSHANQSFCPCDYAFIVERGNYTFRASDLLQSNNNRPMETDSTMPLVLDWAIRGNTSISCSQAQATEHVHEYACRSIHSLCVNATNGPGYFCNCTKGYEGNPYIVDGCKNINECKRPAEFPCHGKCQDNDGSYDCKCPPGYHSDGDPKETPCNPKLPNSAKLIIGITVGTSVLLFIILGIGVCYMLKRIQQKEKERQLEAIEKKNGSERLKNVKTLLLFTKEELDQITNNNSVPLGKGGFGEIHKGTLSDKTEVAVKASNQVTKATLDEFVQEVEIQSRMMHRNILKLLGCCLRVDVPLLVYEYAAKGSLQDILHGKSSDQKREPLTLRSRFDIAIGSAQGLAYMHSYTENGIQHADVKPGNILLDGGLVPKISDFGLSKVFKAGKDYTINVVGCLAYMDPVYKDTGRLTPKSDVYSFGIVLLELISRKPVGNGESNLVKQFKRVFEQDNTGKELFDRDIAAEEDIPILDEIAILALKCLKKKVEDRPAMVSVASALVMLKVSWEEKRQCFSSTSGNLGLFEGAPPRSDSLGK